MLKDFYALDGIVESSVEAGSTRRLATIANSRNRLAKTILAFVVAKGDPKYKLALQDSSADKDLASLVKSVLAMDSSTHKNLMTYKVMKTRKKPSGLIFKDDDAAPEKEKIKLK